jgi:hypothetical protein
MHMCVCIYIHTHTHIYICNPISPSWNTGPLQGFSIWLFLAVCLISFQGFPIIFSSSSNVILHVTFGPPHPRLPCAFQSKASHAISLGNLRCVWPSHPHFQCRISKSILIWLVLVHRTLSDIWTGQNMRKILQRHLLIKTCNCFVLNLSYEPGTVTVDFAIFLVNSKKWSKTTSCNYLYDAYSHSICCYISCKVETLSLR